MEKKKKRQRKKKKKFKLIKVRAMRFSPQFYNHIVLDKEEFERLLDEDDTVYELGDKWYLIEEDVLFETEKT